MNEVETGQPTDAGQWMERAERILVCARRVRGLLEEQAGRCGLSEPELALLWICTKAPAGGSGQRELADDLAVSPAHISGLVERLHRAGLLRARAAADDRRRRLWELTPVGFDTWQAVLNGLAAAIQHRGAA